MTNHRTKKLSVLTMMIALDVLLTPIFRIEGMAFMSSVVNIIAGVLMGPLYAIIMAFATAVIRIFTQGGVASVAPLAILGACPGALLAGICYRMYPKDWMAWLGEFIGTGIIGSVISAPVMVWYWTQTANGNSELLMKASAAQSLLLFTPRFVGATLIGGIIAILLLKGLKRLSLFQTIQAMFKN
ncbi:energy coupling factor transporter S component ThiW [Streptococcus dysgalactiae]|uniref:Energy coupling factor transporter S component ThiW n=1 Tax=Streptococcus dysgalactiae TaxID=1334 RepID=A0AAF0A1L3_STRDY|nr:energy coupling factor transporter S component ThiW [Streptococcus dysgalactiae]QGH05184.1 energy coupling factor transporter S component ThiW [Streptococcus dysgalactiae subsp. dysgalactiae]WAI94189.1 energy coupling factor transporter S component ThiW [Streptococcus dysgalactiae]